MDIDRSPRHPPFHAKQPWIHGLLLLSMGDYELSKIGKWGHQGDLVAEEQCQLSFFSPLEVPQTLLRSLIGFFFRPTSYSIAISKLQQARKSPYSTLRSACLWEVHGSSCHCRPAILSFCLSKQMYRTSHLHYPHVRSGGWPHYHNALQDSLLLQECFSRLKADEGASSCPEILADPPPPVARQTIPASSPSPHDRTS